VQLARLQRREGFQNCWYERLEMDHAVGRSPDKGYAHDEGRQILLEFHTTVHRDERVVLAFHAPKQFAIADARPTAAGYRIDTVALEGKCEV
jgi:hypothetical protein